jgi:hypothetical protein
MAAKLTRLTHKIAMQLHLVAESCTICTSRSRRPARKFWIHPRTYLATDWMTVIQFSAGARMGFFFSIRHRVQTGSGAHSAPYSMSTGGSYPGHGVKLTTYLHLVTMLRIHGAVPPTFQYLFMAWCSGKHSDKIYFYISKECQNISISLFHHEINFCSIDKMITVLHHMFVCIVATVLTMITV